MYFRSYYKRKEFQFSMEIMKKLGLEKQKARVLSKDKNFLLIEPEESLKLAKIEDQFDQKEDKFKSLLFEKPLVILVPSKRSNFKVRQAIRETWAVNEKQVFFIVGKEFCQYPVEWLESSYSCELNEYWQEKLSHNATDSLSKDEQELYKNVTQKELDMNDQLQNEENVILLDCLDIYDNLTMKVLLGFDWLYKSMTAQKNQNQTPVKWVMKLDDDCLLRINSLEKYLSENYSKHKYFYSGRIMKGSRVLKKGKWAEFEYENKKYPDYADGSSGYILSLDLVKYLSNHSKTLKPYHNEDTSIAIWLKNSPLHRKIYISDTIKSKIKMINMGDGVLSNEEIKNRSLRKNICEDSRKNKNALKNGNLFSSEQLILGHHLGESELRFCWENLFLGLK